MTEADKRSFFPAAAGRRRIRVLYRIWKTWASPYRLADAKPGIIAHELRCFDLEGEWANIRAST
jgi:hypothetical protein